MPRTRTALSQEAKKHAVARDARVGAGQRKAHGVVHTPPEIARSMVREADRMLRGVGLARGIASEGLVVVDPSCGPGVFFSAVLDHTASRRMDARLVGVDIDASAVDTARALLSGTCATRGIPLALSCADTLALAPESLVADATHVLVLGNPPWAARTELRHRVDPRLDAWKVDHAGAPLEERKLGVLSDAYVRFFRYCAELARLAPQGGGLALVTNGSFLDGPVHRGMRASLLEWFAHVDVIDLGGSALVASDGVRDENVFGVRTTVAITLAARAPASCKRYLRLRGSKSEKIAALGTKLAFAPLDVYAPHFALRPTPRRGGRDAGLALDAIFPFHREGVQTNRDRAVIAKDAPALLARLRAFAKGMEDEALEAASRESPHYAPDVARAQVREALARDPEGQRGIAVRAIAYRPFDERVYAPIAPFCHRPRADLAHAVARSSRTLVTVRKDRGEATWRHFGVVRAVPDNCFLSNRSSCRTRAFPSHDPDGKENVSEAARAAFALRIGRAPTSSELIAYVLAVLASETYRARAADILRLDYPEIPLPTSNDLFDLMVRAGEDLVAAFLETRGPSHAKIGHYSIEFAPPALQEALEGAEKAFREVW